MGIHGLQDAHDCICMDKLVSSSGNVCAQVSVSLSGYVLAAPWSGGNANYSYPLYFDMGAGVQDHFLNWKVCA